MGVHSREKRLEQRIKDILWSLSSKDISKSFIIAMESSGVISEGSMQSWDGNTAGLVDESGSFNVSMGLAWKDFEFTSLDASGQEYNVNEIMQNIGMVPFYEGEVVLSNQETKPQELGILPTEHHIYHDYAKLRMSRSLIFARYIDGTHHGYALGAYKIFATNKRLLFMSIRKEGTSVSVLCKPTIHIDERALDVGWGKRNSNFVTITDDFKPIDVKKAPNFQFLYLSPCTSTGYDYHQFVVLPKTKVTSKIIELLPQMEKTTLEEAALYSNVIEGKVK